MNVLQRLQERFWFVPTVLSLAAFVLAQGLVALDRVLEDAVIPSWLGVLLFRVGENGSRDILGAVASSSLAVAGTTFSITMAVLALTSSSYGPRLVRNFMADRGNQVVLGVFVATFLYSLLVLRSIRVIGDPGDQEAEVFVPHLAVNGAVLLAVLNVGVLVYFIHHISDSIQIATLARQVRTDLRSTVERLYPTGIGHDQRVLDDADAEADLPDRLDEEGAPVTAGRPGYVQSVREEALLAAACEHDVLIALRTEPGRYVLDDTPLAIVYPPQRHGVDLQAAVRSAVVVADARSPYQDVAFAVQQLTEMAVRALSPGTNDPFTAVNALDDLAAGLTLLAARELPSAARYDDDGVLRVHAPRSSVVDLVSTVLDNMRWYAADAPAVMHAALQLVERLAGHARHRELRARLLTQVGLLREAFERAGHQEHDVKVFADHADRVTRVITAPSQTSVDPGRPTRPSS
ncbi:DUF2254 domain-containing protein [Quadrisphaera sp. GCM10027208]|uniref:DUF2254 domain-containing protein n=1 Tax=Quadrisphaera sp. GCM10027208 TaxID=3273423 RepID=UPI00360E83FC